MFFEFFEWASRSWKPSHYLYNWLSIMSSFFFVWSSLSNLLGKFIQKWQASWRKNYIPKWQSLRLFVSNSLVYSWVLLSQFLCSNHTEFRNIIYLCQNSGQWFTLKTLHVQATPVICRFWQPFFFGLTATVLVVSKKRRISLFPRFFLKLHTGVKFWIF